MSTLRAHIFKRRVRGVREEVDIKLFNRDGSPLDLAGGGGGGGSAAYFYGIQSPVIEYSPLGFSLDVPWGSQVVASIEGMTLENGGKDLVVPQGAYSVYFRGLLQNLDASADSGHIDIRGMYADTNGAEDEVFNASMQLSAPLGKTSMIIEKSVTYITPDAGKFRLRLEQNIMTEEEGPRPWFNASRAIIVKL